MTNKSCCISPLLSWHKEFNGVIDSAVGRSHYSNSITWPKGLILPHINHLVIRNLVVPLPLPSESHDTNTDGSGIPWPKKSCCISFWLSLAKEYVGVIDDAFGITWCQCQRHHMTKKSHIAHNFGCVDLRNTYMQADIFIVQLCWVTEHLPGDWALWVGGVVLKR